MPKKVVTGSLNGVEWSSEETAPVLRDFARENGLPNITSRTSKPDIVKALDKASKKEAKAAAKAAAAEAPPAVPAAPRSKALKRRAKRRRAAREAAEA